MTAKRSPIGWTDFSGGPLNFVIRGTASGDCELSEGCAHCYAKRILIRGARMPGLTTHSEAKLDMLRTTTFPEGLQPFRRGPGSRPLAFVCDMGDIAHPLVPSDFIRKAFDEMAWRPDVDWQVLTKRTQRLAEVLAGQIIPRNIWIGTTTENQRRFDERIDWLRSIDAIRFLSFEPLLGPIAARLEGIDWAIVGGESGPHRRPFNPDWAISIREECRARSTAFFFKQGSAATPGQDSILEGFHWKAFPACRVSSACRGPRLPVQCP